jgi:hypothetical protein
MMKEKVLLLCSVLMALAVVSAIQPAQAEAVNRGSWIAPAYAGTDAFYGGVQIVAYKTGTTATLAVLITNTLFPTATMSGAYMLVLMDWATTNATSGAPVDIPANQFHLFEVSIPVPDTTTASNLYLHSFRVWIRYSHPVAGVSTMEHWEITADPNMPTSNNFAVYSADQLDYQNLRRQVMALGNTYLALPAGMILGMGMGMTSDAKDSWAKAAVEAALGDISYLQGSFSDAKTHYDTALNHTQDAITSDVEKTASFEDSVIGFVDAGKSCLSMLGIAFPIFGVGFLLMGIGVVIYLIRRSKPPAA